MPKTLQLACILAAIGLSYCTQRADQERARAIESSVDTPTVPPTVEAPEERPVTLDGGVPFHPDAGDIAAEVSSFRGFKRCSSALVGKVPPGVYEVMSDIGYHRVAGDACRTLQALAERSISACDGLQIRAARLGCQRRYAMYHGEPDLCPEMAEHGARDPLCVAVSMRDPSMCYAELDRHQVGVCRAIILRNERPCRVAHENATAASRCGRAAKRWWSVIPPSRPQPALPVGFTPSFSLCSTMTSKGVSVSSEVGPSEPTDGGDSAGCIDISYFIKRGIVLRSSGPIIIGSRIGPPIGETIPVIEIELDLPRLSEELPLEYDIATADASVWLDMEPALVSSEGEDCSEGRVKIERFAPRRGAILSGSFEIVHKSKQLRGELLTFIRDVVEEP